MTGNQADAAAAALPAPLRTVRVLLYAGAALTVITTAGFLAANGVSAQTAGQATWGAWPGIAAVFLARHLAAAGRRRFLLIVVVCAFWILGALASLGNGDPRGLTGLILPTAILIYLTRPASKDFLLG